MQRFLDNSSTILTMFLVSFVSITLAIYIPGIWYVSTALVVSILTAIHCWYVYSSTSDKSTLGWMFYCGCALVLGIIAWCVGWIIKDLFK